MSNVFFDTSGSEKVRAKDILDAINLFTNEHVVFSSGTPYTKIKDQIREIDQLNVSDYVKEHIFRLNIKNLLALKI